ncbi:Cof-type HAD-IIB family hydrolase [uncultured Dokdonia sp.]|uniref:Cof-type HAD-IIB family hydrolase n=1 Tax=Dokdonia sp. R78006 TaxID=3093866 RepID=UPI0026345026|nr:Cof-type HAD-IIB family hydrolase [uncultured Dokdonia sp.]
MENTIKILCSDIDGTLLNKERWLSDETVYAFAKAGLPLILTSSRPPQAMRYLQEGLGNLGEPLIAFNGGLIIGKDNAVIESNTFPTSLLENLVSHHAKHTYNLSIYSHEHWFTDKEDEWSLREINNTRATPVYQTALESLDFLNKEHLGIHKLMCMGDPAQLDEIIKLLTPDYGDTVHFYRSKDTYIEITPKNVDKATALRKLLVAEYNYEMSEVMAFGDNHNDDELIKNVGLGVAVANATDTLKSLADYVSPFTNKENAVALAINKFLIAD